MVLSVLRNSKHQRIIGEIILPTAGYWTEDELLKYLFLLSKYNIVGIRYLQTRMIFI